MITLSHFDVPTFVANNKGNVCPNIHSLQNYNSNETKTTSIAHRDTRHEAPSDRGPLSLGAGGLQLRNRGRGGNPRQLQASLGHWKASTS